MNIGDYVRTKEFGINRVAYFDNGEPILENGFTALQSSGYESNTNIIDLIQVGDYVNGKEVIAVDTLTKQIVYEYGECDGFIEEKYIYSILTKEQIERNEYEI